MSALAEGRQAGDLLRLAPGALLLADGKEPAAGAAVARRGARHREDHVHAANRQRLAPAAVPLADDEGPRAGARGERVGPAGAAVARRAARHRGDLGIPAPGEGRQAGDLLRFAPGAVLLADDEGVQAGGHGSGGAAVARRGAGQRGDLSLAALAEG